MSENSNENKVILSKDLILYIFSFYLNPFHKSIPLNFLFDTKEDYIIKKNLYNMYSNFVNFCKEFYSLKKDYYIIFNKKYSKKYIKSEEFREKISNIIDTKYLLIYSKKSEGNFTTDCLVNYCNGKENIVKFYFNRYSIHKLKNTYKEVLIFMKLENTQVKKVSKSHIIEQITNFIKNEKLKKNPDIFVEGNKTSFRLIGDLKILFDFIKMQMIIRGDLKNPEDFPEHIRYIQILKYIEYCFKKF